MYVGESPSGEPTFLINDLGRAFTYAGIGNKMQKRVAGDAMHLIELGPKSD